MTEKNVSPVRFRLQPLSVNQAESAKNRTEAFEKCRLEGRMIGMYWRAECRTYMHDGVYNWTIGDRAQFPNPAWFASNPLESDDPVSAAGSEGAPFAQKYLYPFGVYMDDMCYCEACRRFHIPKNERNESLNIGKLGPDEITEVVLSRWDAPRWTRGECEDKSRCRFHTRNRALDEARNAEWSKASEAAAAVVSAKTKQSVYVLEAGGFYKIGIAVNVSSRVSTLQTGCPYAIRLVASNVVKDARGLEAQLHDKYSHGRKVGEWFSLSESELAEIVAQLRCGLAWKEAV